MTQYRQPKHLSRSISTMPSSRLWEASVGQASTQGASLHWLQRTGYVDTSTFIPSSVSRAISLGQVTRSGRKCSILHAATHAWHLVHFARLITIPHLMCVSLPLLTDARHYSTPKGLSDSNILT